MASSIPDPVPENATPEQMKRIINYWSREAKCDHGRWVSAMEEYDRFKKRSYVAIRNAGVVGFLVGLSVGLTAWVVAQVLLR